MRVPVTTSVLGEINGGWRTMAVALAFERGVMGGTNVAVPLLRHFRKWAAHHIGDDGVRLIDDPLVRERLARIAIDNEVAKLLTQRSAWIAASGGLPGLEGSMTKVFASEALPKGRALVPADGRARRSAAVPRTDARPPTAGSNTTRATAR